ncbi:MAG: GNAT family N-acetyltransferase [Candidatus Hodarchaeota archaeon]
MKLVIRKLKKNESVEELLEFINELIREDTYINTNEIITYEEEKKWLQDTIKEMEKGDSVVLVAEIEGKIVGTAYAFKGRGRKRENVEVGIAIGKNFRGKGFGKKLLNEIITTAKKKLEPKNIYLEVLAPNRVAISLYRKLGFKQAARLKSWSKYRNEYVDNIIMVLAN